ncbi:MAG: hypothetical protein JO051_11070 [Acidobacteriaceae bacterium]|nr:hypothetical protein [Acidobacteriaceae bacterium]
MHTGESGAYTLLSDAPEALRKIAEQFEKDGYAKADPWYERDWDVMWSLGYPYQRERSLAPQFLRADQLINRYPVARFCAKSSLAQLPFEFIPQAFDLPQQMPEFVEAYAKHPEKLWVRKNQGHRGVRLTTPHEVELFQRKSASPIFVQEFVKPPHLICGRKWDVGVFIVLTSLEPLRLYAYQDITLRFCPKCSRPPQFEFMAAARNSATIPLANPAP